MDIRFLRHVPLRQTALQPCQSEWIQMRHFYTPPSKGEVLFDYLIFAYFINNVNRLRYAEDLQRTFEDLEVRLGKVGCRGRNG